MPFALHKRPGGVIFLDDDPDYLEMLAEVMPADWYIRLLISPLACIELLLLEPARWEADAWEHQEIINRWREGASLIDGILKYWRKDGANRFALTQVCVVDYAMPAMSGIQVIGELKGWTGSRVLLTGRVEEQLAVSAFNRGLIEKFVPKQAPDIRLRLTDAIGSLLGQPDARHQQTWRATLSREQHALLCDAAVTDALDDLVAREGWIEHIAIGAPFGVLGLDRHSRVTWLQLEPAGNLPELAGMAESQGWNPETVDDIKAGRKLVDLELKLALGPDHRPQLEEAFGLGGDNPAVYGALFRLGAAVSPTAAQSHHQFLVRCGDRQLMP
jgi:CheY-like chemotaxis protein